MRLARGLDCAVIHAIALRALYDRVLFWWLFKSFAAPRPLAYLHGKGVRNQPALRAMDIPGKLCSVHLILGECVAMSRANRYKGVRDEDPQHHSLRPRLMLLWESNHGLAQVRLGQSWSRKH
jgi:hypothetical protein